MINTTCETLTTYVWRYEHVEAVSWRHLSALKVCPCESCLMIPLTFPLVEFLTILSEGRRFYNLECVNQCFQNTFCMKGTLKCFSYPEESSPLGTFAGQKMVIVGSAIKWVIFYCQEGLFFKEMIHRNAAYSAKRLRHISPDNWNSCRISKFVFIHSFRNFLPYPWRWSAELWLGSSG
jgi:hypothetical protein